MMISHFSGAFSPIIELTGQVFMPSDIREQPPGQTVTFEFFSRSIGLLRFPLIVLIVFIHARFQGPDYPDAATEHLCKSLFWGKMPHCAVAAFFLFSGYLLASRTMRRRNDQGGIFVSYPDMLRRKFKSLVIPYFIWNTLVMLPHLLIWALHLSSSLLPSTKFAGMNFFQILVRTYGLDPREYPIDVPLWYIRSLMLLFLISPVLLFLIRHLPKYLSLCLIIAGTFLLSGEKEVLFFSFGIFCGYFDVDLRPIKKHWFLYLVPMPAFCLLVSCLPSIRSDVGANLVMTMLNWLFFLFLAAFAELLGRLPEKSREWLVLAGGYSFWIFCSHAPVATTLSRIGLRFHCLGMPPLLWILLSCAVTITITLGGFYVVRRVAPRATAVLCGGRLPK